MIRRTVVLIAASLALAGCGLGMPDHGAVHETKAGGSDRDAGSVNIHPLRPAKGASPEEIVRGFLEAMKETPAVTTAVAREFLTKDAASSWSPTKTYVYSQYLSPDDVGPRGTDTDTGKVEVKLIDVDQLDGRGAWLGPLPDDQSTISFGMRKEDDEWRIADPPQKLIVPQSWFLQRFQQASLYFFDPSATMLIPEPVFVPRGQQFASSLINGLLLGPSNELAASEQNYLPSGLRLLSVPVDQDGEVSIDLKSDSEDATLPSPDQTELLVSQLAWTLQQEPAIKSFRVSIDGQPVQLPGEVDFSVDRGHQYAPYVAGSSTQLFGLQDVRMVGGSAQNLEKVTGPFGSGDYDLTTISPDLRAENVAGLVDKGRSLWIAPVKENGEDAKELLQGRKLLRPAWDFSGRLWDVDRGENSAVVYYVPKNRRKPRVLDVPGITGQHVRDFLVSRDGSRLLAVVRDPATRTDSVVVSRITTTSDGQTVLATAAETISTPSVTEPEIDDIAWRTPISIVVAYPIDSDLFRIRSLTVDGAGAGDDPLSITIDQPVLGLVGTPVPKEPIYAFTKSDTQTSLAPLPGPRGQGIEIDPRVKMLSYVS
jgi:hypothetical protein